MMDITTLSAALQGLFALQEMVKVGYSVRNANEIAQRLAEVYGQLMPFLSAAVESQQRELALTNRIRDLEKENMELKDWNHERERYALHEIMTGRFVYRLQPGMENGEPAHDLCANCFTQGKKAILQTMQTPGFAKTACCSRCKMEMGLETHKISTTSLMRG